MLKTTDGGTSWTLLTALTGNFVSVSFADTAHGWLIRENSFDLPH